MKVSEGKEREKVAENLYEEIVAENVLNLGRYVDIQYTRLKGSLIGSTQRRLHRHIITELSKIKENFDSSNRKESCYIQSNLYNIISRLLAETLQAKREWDDTFKVLKEKNLPVKRTIPSKFVFKK